MDFYDNILNDEIQIDGYQFEFISNFKIIDSINGFNLNFCNFFKRSYKGYESEISIIEINNPYNIKNIYNINLEDFKINKLYKGIFIVHFYDNYNIDIFLKNLK